MDDKIGKIMASDNYDRLIKGGFTPKQAVTQMALMAQGFADVDPETKAMISKKIEEVKDAANIGSGSPAPVVSTVETEADLINAWGKNNHSSSSKSLGKLLNVDADAATVRKAMGIY